MKDILILCTGNSCRSQMAQAYLQAFDKNLEVHSAGTNPAERVHPMAIEVMLEDGYDISRQKTKHVEQYLGKCWDYVITVCGGANESCPVFSGSVEHRLHFGFDDPAAVSGSQDYIKAEFRRIRDEIKNRFLRFDTEELL